MNLTFILSRALRLFFLLLALPLALLVTGCIGLAIWVEDALEGPGETADYKKEETNPKELKP